MPTRTMDQTLDHIGEPLLTEFDEITRGAHGRYRSYRSEDLIELDVRAQAACTYAHMLAEADRRFFQRPGVRTLDVRGLKLWHFEEPNIVIRFKKVDEDGRGRNYPTKQAQSFDQQLDLPGLPQPPVRLTAGYFLDRTGTEFIRTQISRPDGRDILWCGAIFAPEERRAGERIWWDATRQPRFA